MADRHVTEWLEADGLGGFASGPVRRRAHAALPRAAAGRDAAARARARAGERRSSVARDRAAAPGPSRPSATPRRRSTPTARPLVEAFAHDPWPTWRYACADGTRVEQRAVRARTGGRRWSLRWRPDRPGGGARRLRVRPLLSGRDYHALHHENPAFRVRAEDVGGERAAPGALRRRAGDRRRSATAATAHEPDCGTAASTTPRSARAGSTDERGPGGARRAARSISADGEAVLAARRPTGRCPRSDARRGAPRRRERARRRGASRPRSQRAADAYIVRARRPARRSSPATRGSPTGAATRSSPCAGCASRPAASTTRARSCSSGRARCREGMLPNRFPDGGDAPEYNSVDASLWYVVAVHELPGGRAGARRRRPSARRSSAAVEAILDGLRARHPLRHPRRRRRPARRGRAGRAAHLDGREGRRLGGHAAHRQAGGDPGALAERARDRGALHASAERWRDAARAQAAPAFAARFWNEDARLAATTWSTSITCPARVDASVPPEPDPRRRRPAVRRCSTARAPAPWSTRSRRAC